MNMNIPLIARGDSPVDCFWLHEIQIFNWGTFSEINRFPVARKGYVFAGPSGAGKSTAMDAHATLITPARERNYNAAARTEGKRGRDRNLMSYVRGAYGTITDKSFETVKQHLRPDTTWSAIAETYKNDSGHTVTLAHVYYVRGSQTDGVPHGRYFVFEKYFDIADFSAYALANFDKRYVNQHWPDAHYSDDFSSYEETMRRLLGIESKAALKLLQLTQSTKDLGDITKLMRDFMLDEPQTFRAAEELVLHVNELMQANEAIERAQKQIDVLMPARLGLETIEKCKSKSSALSALTAVQEPYIAQHRARVLGLAMEHSGSQVDLAKSKADELERSVQSLDAEVSTLKAALDGNAGQRIQTLEHEIEQLQKKLPERQRKHGQFTSICDALEIKGPSDAEGFLQAQAQARKFMDQAQQGQDQFRARDRQLSIDIAKTSGDLQSTRNEIELMERHPTNIDSKLVLLRDRIASALNIDPAALPFAGELMQVRESEKPWRGAIERVLGGLSKSLVVEQKLFKEVSQWINDNHLHGRLVYLRMVPQVSARAPSANAIARKIEFAAGPMAQWLAQEIQAHHDFECCQTAEELSRSVGRGVTITGQVKHNATRYEKDDRQAINDPSRWVMGFSNLEKLEIYKTQFQELSITYGALVKERSELEGNMSSAQAKSRHCQTLMNLSWEDVDIQQLLISIRSHHEQLKKIRDENPNLQQLSEQWTSKREELSAAKDAASNALGIYKQNNMEMQKIRDQRDALDAQLLAQEIDAEHKQAFEQILHGIKNLDLLKWTSHEGLALCDVADKGISLKISDDLRANDAQLGRAQHEVLTALSSFVNQWPEATDGLDASMESATAFMLKLKDLETDDLPSFKQKFARLFHEQSDQMILTLSTRLDSERAAITERIDQVNDALERCDYNPGTHLKIKSLNIQSVDVDAFKKKIRAILSHSLDGDALADGQRFSLIKSLVEDLKDERKEDWRKTVLDVRKHLEFIAQEFDRLSGEQLESYRGSGGKSGGQGQKLTLTILAAALRYQLGGMYGSEPVYRTIMIDEAFDKTDADFTRMTMRIFANFGFQMVVATPLKAVMVLDEFIGGACFIHMEGRNKSCRKLIEYDEASQQLKLDDNLRRQIQSTSEAQALETHL